MASGPSGSPWQQGRGGGGHAAVIGSIGSLAAVLAKAQIGLANPEKSLL